MKKLFLFKTPKVEVSLPSELPSKLPSKLPIDEPKEQIPETETTRIGCEAYSLPTRNWPISGLKIPTNAMCGYVVEDPVEHSSGKLLSSALTECFNSLANHRVLIIVFSLIISPELIEEIFIARQLQPLIVNGDSELDDGKIFKV